MHVERVSKWLLLSGFEPRWLDGVATFAVVVGLVASRFALLASGPWEWDETLFARGLLHFELAAHFPHPPGFPLWLGVGLVLLPLAGEPLVALQWASAAASVLMVWPLTHLGRRVAPAPVALAAAVLVLLVPGPWLHAVRGFSSTPATLFLLLAAVVATSASVLRRPRATAFTALVTAAFLIRPILLPVLGLLWLSGARRASDWRALVPGVVGGSAAIAAAVVAMAWAEGGWGRFLTAFATHARRHSANLVRNTGGIADLGLVVGFGPVALAVCVAVLGAIGLLVWWRRRGWGEALTWTVLLAVMVGQLALLQNRTYTRYAVPMQLAVAPLVAAGAGALAPASVAGLGLVGLAAVAAAHAYPLLVEQHADQLPGWRAVKVAEQLGQRHQLAVVDEAGLYPFTSYHWHATEHAGGSPPPRTLSPWAPEAWQGVDRPWLVVTDMPGRYLKPLTGWRIRYDGVSAALEPFTQRRFLTAEVLIVPSLNVGTWWPVERPAEGGEFMWGGPGAELWLPPAPPGRRFELDLQPARGEPLALRLNGALVDRLDAGVRRRWWLPTTAMLRADRPNVVRFERRRPFRPGSGDFRELAVQLFGVRQVGPHCAWGGPLATPAQRRALAVDVTGCYRPEQFAGGYAGVWLEPSARVRLPAGAGELLVRLAAPRPVPPATVVRVGDRQVAGPLDLDGTLSEVRLRLRAEDVHDGMVVVRLDSVPYVPARHGASGDHRELGVVVSSAHFRPAVRRW
jgi:hypothetical protein